MSSKPESKAAGFDYLRDEPFSYVCNRCKRCCYGKRIPLNPYDLIRLAEVLNITTGELIERHTLDGVSLKVRGDVEGGPCVFLGEQGCTVHAGRPGACRVYPLGRSSTLAGDERFALVEPDPKTAGVYGVGGTIGSFLDSQGTQPYFEASNRYVKLFGRLATEGTLESDDIERPDDPGSHVLDVDATIESYCRERHRPVPSDAKEKMLMHIEAIEAMLDGDSVGTP